MTTLPDTPVALSRLSRNDQSLAEFKARAASMGIVKSRAKARQEERLAGWQRGLTFNPPLRALELPYPTHTGNHSVRHAGGRHYLTPEALAYRSAVVDRVGYGAHQVEGPLRCDWLLAPPDRRARDVDNLMKVVCDALTHAGFWKDDSNKVICAGSWSWAPPVPGGAIYLSVFSHKEA